MTATEAVEEPWSASLYDTRGKRRMWWSGPSYEALRDLLLDRDHKEIVHASVRAPDAKTIQLDRSEVGGRWTKSREEKPSSGEKK